MPQSALAMQRAAPVEPVVTLPKAHQGRLQPLLPVWQDPRTRLLLTATGSMTRLLAGLWGLPVRVELQRETMTRPTAFEARCAGARGRGGWWCREIVLRAGGQPRLFARTMLPPESRHLQAAVRQLASTPLMTLLFDGDRLRSGVVRQQRWFGRDPAGHWWRQTCYRAGGEPLLLFEALLTGAHADGEREPGQATAGLC